MCRLKRLNVCARTQHIDCLRNVYFFLRLKTFFFWFSDKKVKRISKQNPFVLPKWLHQFLFLSNFEFIT